MSQLAETGRAHGRWIIAPRKGAQFLGVRHRARMRARARRRRVFIVLLEAMGLTFLMGLFPPFRVMWFATGALACLLVVYVAMLLAIRRNEHEVRRMRTDFERAAREPAGAAAMRSNGNGHPNGNGHRVNGNRNRGGLQERHVAIGRGHNTRPAYSGLSIIDDEDVHVVVRELEPASAR